MNPLQFQAKSMDKRPILQTRRLLLRPFELIDAKEVQHLAGERDVADTTLKIPHPYEYGVAEHWIWTQEARFRAGEAVNFAIVVKDGNILVGSVSLEINRIYDRAELGYWIGKPFWNEGYCTEAASAVIDYGFREMGLHRIHASHFLRNPASGRVMQKVGMSPEGTARQHVKKWDRYEDLVLYGVLRGDRE